MRTSMIAGTFAAGVVIALSAPAQAKVPESVADDRPGPGSVTPESAHYDLELLYGEGKINEGLALARRRLQSDPEDPELYRHVARFLFEKGELVDRNDPDFDKVALYTEMYDLLNKALELDPNNAHLLFNRGIALGRLSTTKGVLSSMVNLKTVQNDWLAAAAAPYRYSSLEEAEHMPCSVYQTLGIFYRLVPDSWLVGVLAGVRGDLDKSLMWLEKADSCRPNRIGVLKELGATQLCIGDRRKDPAMTERGLTTLRRIEGIQSGHTLTAIDKRHAKMMIDDPTKACGYSRDGQQELDEKALEKKRKEQDTE
ncbi:MAG: hypothetical protein EA397_16505 [Deltaproteobacteria bacterium]|nr:MAG: hypothetical protein EA397_16505 [Deltaproteobacteria bacterium]